MTDCKHETVEQRSTIYAMTVWSYKQELDSYEPEQVPCSQVLSEETESWICSDCGAHVELAGDGLGVQLVVL